MRTVGIIGGLGPETTARFYLSVSFSCQEKNDQSRPPILVYSVPISYAVEEDAVMRGQGEERLVPLLTDAARRLEKAGADFLVMPCNSLHEFIDDIRGSVKIPVLNIVEETVRFLKNEGVTKTGIVSTSITRDKKLYKDLCVANGIDLVDPDELQQARINGIILDLISDKRGDQDKKELMGIIDDLAAKGVRHVVLACTDLQLLDLDRPGLKLFDTMNILADAAVREMRKSA